MQIKITPMKNLKTTKPNGKRDHWRSYNKIKTTRIRAARVSKRLAQVS